jgi:hypothetical protein
MRESGEIKAAAASRLSSCEIPQGFSRGDRFVFPSTKT